MFGQMKRAVINFCVALIPGCERECNESKMALRNLEGTYGRGVPVDTSQSNVTSVSKHAKLPAFNEVAKMFDC